MANEEINKEISQEPEKQQEAPVKKRGLLKRLALLGLILVLVLAAAALTTMEDGRHFASLRRWLMYGESSQTQNLYTYAADQSNRYGRMGGDLLVVSSKAIQLLRDDGTALYDLQVNLTAPSLSVGRTMAAVCDVGGGTLYVLDSAGVKRTLTLDRGLCYYTARMNDRDYLAVVEQKNGYKASVSVYDSKAELVYYLDSYESYISDAVVTEDGQYLVAVVLDPQGGAFASSLRVYGLGSASAEPVWECSIRDALVMDFAVTGDRVVSLCDKRLTITTLEGETLLDRAYGNLYFHDYALTGGDFCALLLGRYQAGNICQLTTYSLDGEELATLEVTEEVLDLSAAGEYLAVLYSDSLVIYTRDLTEYARLTGTDYAGRVQMEENGTALVIAGASAWRFLP